MKPDEELKKASNAVDKAWKQLKAHHTHYNETAYDNAYDRWKKLGYRRPGVGRRPGGETDALTSTKRAHATRERQRSSALKWEKIAAFVQQLRADVRKHDQSQISDYVKSLINDTEIILHDLEVIHAQPDADIIVISCRSEDQAILAFIEKADIEHYFDDVLGIAKELSHKEANRVVDNNMKLIAGIISAKYERGEYRPYLRFGQTFPRVDIAFRDLKRLSERLPPVTPESQKAYLI